MVAPFRVGWGLQWCSGMLVSWWFCEGAWWRRFGRLGGGA